jgi:hypothetical protein
MRESVTLVGCNVIGLVALDFILGGMFGRVVEMSLVLEILCMDDGDPSGYPTSLGIPTDVIADLEFLDHLAAPPLLPQ